MARIALKKRAPKKRTPLLKTRKKPVKTLKLKATKPKRVIKSSRVKKPTARKSTAKRRGIVHHLTKRWTRGSISKKAAIILFIIGFGGIGAYLLFTSFAGTGPYYVATNGSGTSCTSSAPCPLSYALTGAGGKITAGATVYLKAGTYAGPITSSVTGTSSAPITFRPAPGEWVILEARSYNQFALVIRGSYTVWRDFEIRNTDTNRNVTNPDLEYQSPTVSTESHGAKVINNYIHDGRGGIHSFGKYDNVEIYGNMIYYSGFYSATRGRGTAHGIYAQTGPAWSDVNAPRPANAPSPGQNFVIEDNMIFAGFIHGAQIYGKEPYIANFNISGNTFFRTGQLSGAGEQHLILGGVTRDRQFNNKLVGNRTYGPAGGQSTSNFGYSIAGHGVVACGTGMVMENNYFVAGGNSVKINVPCTFSSARNNTLIGTPDVTVAGTSTLNNIQVGGTNTQINTRPTTGNKVFVEPNKWQSGRAAVTIYNWAKAGSVSINPNQSGTVLSSGQRYKIYDVQNIVAQMRGQTAPTVAETTYNGGNISIPMNGTAVPAVIGGSRTAPSHTSNEFGAFVIVCTTCSGGGSGQPGTPITNSTYRIIPPGNWRGSLAKEYMVYRPSNSTWYEAGQPAVQFGSVGDIPVPADYNGDGYLEMAVWNPSTGVWRVRNGITATLGQAGDIPVQGRYAGESRDQMAVFRPSTGTWYTLTAGATSNPSANQFGQAGDIPVPGDYQGYEQLQQAVFRPSTGTWYIGSTAGGGLQFGQNGDLPVPADYNGDGRTDYAVWRPSNATWYVRGGATQQWGIPTDKPVIGMGFTVYRPSEGNWYTHGGTTQQWGTPEDVPLP